MAMHLQELHPSSVHYPIALLPLSVAADAIGTLTGNRTLLDIGRLTIPIAAASAAVAGVLGLIAQEVVETDDEGMEMLVTHRTLNIGLLGVATAMAVYRAGRDRPGVGYLLTGAAGIGAMAYSAYLGGQMVYDRGVGVRTAGGLREEVAPPVRHILDAARQSARHVASGVRNTVEESMAGEFVPRLTSGRGNDR